MEKTLNCHLVGGPACGRQMLMPAEAGEFPGLAIVDPARKQHHVYVQDLGDPGRFNFVRSKNLVIRHVSEMVGPTHGIGL